MKTTEEELKEDEEYLDKEFPKGKTKFRGQAMVLLALARKAGQQKAHDDVLKIIDKTLIDLANKLHPSNQDYDWYKMIYKELKERIKTLK